MKILKTAFALLLCCALLFSFASCKEESKEGIITVVIESSNSGVSDNIGMVEYEVNLDDVDGEGLVSVFEYLKAKEGITFEMAGTMVDKVGALYNDYTAGVYIYLFTSLERDFDVSEYKVKKEYGGKTLTSAGVGIADMTLAPKPNLSL